MSKKKILYIDLDGVVVDLMLEVERELKSENQNYKGIEELIDNSETVFLNAPPIPHAIEAIEELEKHYDVFILSTAPWNNVNAWFQKRVWVERHLPSLIKKLILTHRKDLLKGDFLIDDRAKNGAAQFSGEHIHIFEPKFHDWDSVLNYLIPKK